MRSSTIHVRPLVALLGAALCAGAALAANYTLTNTTVEWPSSNEAENVSGNRFTIVGDVTVTITNVTVANVSLGALRASMVVTELELPASATVNVTFTSKPVHGGSWTLVDVGTAAPQDLAWTVNASVAGMSVVKSITPAHVAIEALPSGTVILFR